MPCCKFSESESERYFLLSAVNQNLGKFSCSLIKVNMIFMSVVSAYGYIYISLLSPAFPEMNLRGGEEMTKPYRGQDVCCGCLDIVSCSLA